MIIPETKEAYSAHYRRCAFYPRWAGNIFLSHGMPCGPWQHAGCGSRQGSGRATAQAPLRVQGPVLPAFHECDRSDRARVGGASLHEGLLTANEKLYNKLTFGVTVTEFVDGKKH